MNAKGKKRREKAERMQSMRVGFAALLMHKGLPPAVAEGLSTRSARNKMLSTGALREHGGQVLKARERRRAAQLLIQRVPTKS